MEQIIGVIALAVICFIAYRLIRKLRQDNPGGVFRRRGDLNEK